MRGRMFKFGTIFLIAAQAACVNATPPAEDQQPVMSRSANSSDEQGVANLPFSRGQRFATLDAYLAYLEQYNGPIDMPWWREISPGVYQQQLYIANLDVEPETATRAELEERFGFTESR